MRRGNGTPLLQASLLGIFLLAIGCTPKSPEQVLAQAAAKMAAVKSVHFTMDVSLGLTGAGGGNPGSPGALSLTIPLNAQGDLVLPDKVRMALEVKQPIALKVELIGLGDTFYLKDPVSGRWSQVPQEGPTAGLPYDLIDPAQSWGFLKAASLDITDSGLESLDGVRVRHLAFDLDQEKLKVLVQGSQRDVLGEFQQARVEVWIGDADSYLYRQKAELVLAELMSLPIPGSGEIHAKMEWDLRLSDFDKPLEIQLPT